MKLLLLLHCATLCCANQHQHLPPPKDLERIEPATTLTAAAAGGACLLSAIKTVVLTSADWTVARSSQAAESLKKAAVEMSRGHLASLVEIMVCQSASYEDQFRAQANKRPGKRFSPEWEASLNEYLRKGASYARFSTWLQGLITQFGAADDAAFQLKWSHCKHLNEKIESDLDINEISPSVVDLPKIDSVEVLGSFQQQFTTLLTSTCNTVDENAPLEQACGAEVLQGAATDIHKSLKALDEEASKQTKAVAGQVKRNEIALDVINGVKVVDKIETAVTAATAASAGVAAGAVWAAKAGIATACGKSVEKVTNLVLDWVSKQPEAIPNQPKAKGWFNWNALETDIDSLA